MKIDYLLSEYNKRVSEIVKKIDEKKEKVASLETLEIKYNEELTKIKEDLEKSNKALAEKERMIAEIEERAAKDMELFSKKIEELDAAVSGTEKNEKISEKEPEQLILSEEEFGQLEEFDIFKPYVNEHAARIRPPSDFQKESFRSKSITTGVRIIIGRLKGKTTTTTQSYRFNVDHFTATEAKKWLKNHNVKYKTFEPALKKTDVAAIVQEDLIGEEEFKQLEEFDIFKPYINEHAARIRPPSDFKKESFRSKTIATGIRIIIGRLKGKTTTTAQAYRFNVDHFTAVEAKKWLKDHNIKYQAFEPALKKTDIAKCPKCEESFSYTSQQEVKMGVVFCPKCEANVTQDDLIKPEKISELGQKEKALKDGLDKPLKTKTKAIVPTEEIETIDLMNEHEELHKKVQVNGENIGEVVLKHQQICTTFKKTGLKHIDRDDIVDMVSFFKKDFYKGYAMNQIEVPAATFNFWIMTEYLECQIKDIYLNQIFIPQPKIGTYLKGIDEICKDFEMEEIRNFTDNGRESPPVYGTIQLNAKTKEDFLLTGYKFYKKAGGLGFILTFEPIYGGLRFGIISMKMLKNFNRSLEDKIHNWARENNFLKGAKFSLSGEFLKSDKTSWDDLKVKKDLKDRLVKIGELLKNSKETKASRGFLFLGLPGTGKTMSNRILMNLVDSTFIWATTKDLANGAGLGMAFSLARELAPAILCIEDIDTYLNNYNLDLMKTELDGLVANEGMCVILTTNYPERLPPALLDRPGRFHDLCNFELPDEGIRTEQIKHLCPEINDKTLKDIMPETEGFSGAYLKELVDFAKTISQDEECDMNEALIKSLEKLKRQKELIGKIRNKDLDEIEEEKKRLMKP